MNDAIRANSSIRRNGLYPVRGNQSLCSASAFSFDRRQSGPPLRRTRGRAAIRRKGYLVGTKIPAGEVSLYQRNLSLSHGLRRSRHRKVNRI
jgi:hypothetical protein